MHSIAFKRTATCRGADKQDINGGSAPEHQTQRHRQWLQANRNLVNALALFDSLDLGASAFAAHAQAALDVSKRDLRRELRA